MYLPDYPFNQLMNQPVDFEPFVPGTLESVCDRMEGVGLSLAQFANGHKHLDCKVGQNSV